MITRMKVNAEEIKSNLDELAQAALCSALKVLFSETEKKLFVRAEHSTSSADKNKILDQIHHLKRTAEQFERGFIAQSSLPEKTPSNNWYRLYKNRALAIQIEDMISHARAKFGIELAQYESRIKWLNKNYPDLIPDNLYTLPALVTAYLIHTALFDSVTQENLVRILGHQFLNKLEPMYILMNDLLIQNGALPEIKSMRKGGGSSALDDLLEEMALSEASLSEELLQSRTMAKADVLVQLQGILAAGEQLLPKKSTWTAEAFYRALLKHLSTAEQPAELAPKETETVMLTGTIFSGMLNDRLINPLIKTQIAQLQAAILYTALFDDGFLSLAKHPARAVLNKLAIIGSDPAQNAETLKKIPPLIDAFLLNAAKESPPNFEPLLAAITTADQGEFRAPQSSDEVQPTQAQTLISRSQQRVGELVRQEGGSQTLHPVSRQFVEQILAPFLVHILMAHGRQCSEWTQGLNLLQELIEADNHPGSAKKILASISHVYELVDYPFFHADGVSVDLFGSAIAQIVEHLESIRSRVNEVALADEASAKSAPAHTAAVAAASPPAPAPVVSALAQKSPTDVAPTASPVQAITAHAPTPADSPKPSPKAEIPSPPPPVESQPTVELCRFSLETMADPRTRAFMQRFVLNGDWLQIFTADGAALRRLKAHQINQELGTINFSNRNGEIALVLPLVQFFDDLALGRSHPVFDNAAFSKALAQLVEALDAEQP